MDSEKKYGVYLDELKKLKDFQLSLLVKSKKQKAYVMDFSAIISAVVFSDVDKVFYGPAVGRLTVKDQEMMIKYENGTIFGMSTKKIVSINVKTKEVELQFKPESPFEFWTLTFDEDLVENFIKVLPPIDRPEMEEEVNSRSSSESDFEDSGKGGTCAEGSDDSDFLPD